MTPKSLFTLKDGTKLTYERYILEQYKIKLQYPSDQPMIKCYIERNDDHIYLVPECCVLTGITEE